MSSQQFEAIMMPCLIGALILFMAYIVYDLAKQSKAGVFGTWILFGALGLGVMGFIIKTIIYEVVLL